MNGIHLSRDFALALCKHFNFPLDRVSRDIKINTGSDEILSAAITILITPQDLKEIADLMIMKSGVTA